MVCPTEPSVLPIEVGLQPAKGYLQPPHLLALRLDRGSELSNLFPRDRRLIAVGHSGLDRGGLSFAALPSAERPNAVGV